MSTTSIFGVRLRRPPSRQPTRPAGCRAWHGSSGSAAVPHPIRHQHTAAPDGPRLHQFKADTALQWPEERDAGPQQDRMNVQAHFIDGAGVEERARELTTTQETDALARQPLEPVHVASGIGSYKLHAGRSLTQCAGKQIRGHLGDSAAP